MTTRTRSAAENEAGARAIYQNRSQTRWAWEELEQKQRDHFIAVAKDALAAADAVARSVCPPDCVVVRRDDLETALYGSQYWGEELRQDGEQEALDRLRALIGDE